MRLFTTLVLCTTALSTASHGDHLPLPLSCSGSDPDWSLEVSETEAEFSYLFDSDLVIALITTPENGPWPRALTLTGRWDSAILLLTPIECISGTLSATVLTQRAEMPVMLVGCCWADGH